MHCVNSFYSYKDTATTEIYTYLHTLSLHVALPISAQRHHPALDVPDLDAPHVFRRVAVGRLALHVDLPDPAEAVEVIRSEEHTSELQSLMRISYAVFCLK